MMRIPNQKVDLKDPAKVLRRLAAIDGQILDHLYLKLKEVILPYKVYVFRSIDSYKQAKEGKS